MKSKGNGTVAGAVAAEAADIAQGKAQLAANLAAEVAEPVVEQKHRGRKAGTVLTFAKFAAIIRDGGIPDGVSYVAPKQEGSRVIEWGHFEADNPVLDLDPDGNLTLTRLFTAGRSNKPMAEVISTIPAAEVLALLNSRAK